MDLYRFSNSNTDAIWLNLLLLKSAYVRISLLSPHKYTFSINFLEVFTVLYYFVVVTVGKFK